MSTAPVIQIPENPSWKDKACQFVTDLAEVIRSTKPLTLELKSLMIDLFTGVGLIILLYKLLINRL